MNSYVPALQYPKPSHCEALIWPGGVGVPRLREAVIVSGAMQRIDFVFLGFSQPQSSSPAADIGYEDEVEKKKKSQHET